jgi:hypothetical protein
VVVNEELQILAHDEKVKQLLMHDLKLGHLRAGFRVLDLE